MMLTLLKTFKKILQDGIADWSVNLGQSAPIYCITDKDANFCVAAGLLFILQQCFANSLQLAINDAKNECAGVNVLLNEAKAIVGQYSCSTQARKRLHSQMEEMKRSVLELIGYVDTRWCSEYKMLLRLYEVKKAIGAELAISHNNIDMLTQVELKQVAGIIEILGPLAQATNVMETLIQQHHS
ncbi:hypothetical protein PR048_001135 [Dryococelus australis]|uniref:Uncharacterized protein n=1 Tax=Dryococelus australis TaxID=614101 RepID=A0ABQ9IGL4_9NEOP|nr:hypothetical protein PR048_001135 [Dryococelus australis]